MSADALGAQCLSQNSRRAVIARARTVRDREFCEALLGVAETGKASLNLGRRRSPQRSARPRQFRRPARRGPRASRRSSREGGAALKFAAGAIDPEVDFGHHPRRSSLCGRLRANGSFRGTSSHPRAFARVSAHGAKQRSSLRSLNCRFPPRVVFWLCDHAYP